MRTDIHIGIFDVIIFLGVFQGLLLSWFFIKNSGENKKSNLFQGLFLVSVALAIFEEWLNNTGLIVRALYPFYLLHQPALVITGYMVVKLSIPAVMKVTLVMISSFILIVSAYWFLVRPFNVTRVLFGMKPQFNSPINKFKTMKTKEVKREKRSSRLARAVMFSLMLLLLSASLSAQETRQERTLLGPDVTYTTVWTPEVKLLITSYLKAGLLLRPFSFYKGKSFASCGCASFITS